MKLPRSSFWKAALFAVAAISLLAAEDCLSFDPNTAEITFRGGQYLIVEGNSSMLAFGDKQHEAQRALEIIQRYQMDNQCFVGRPDASMKYFLSDGVAPSGSMDEEDCIAFDRASIEVEQIDGRWKITEGASILMDFGDEEAEALQALSIIHEYAFDQMCFVGRPDPSMVYFKTDAAVGVEQDCLPFDPDLVEVSMRGGGYYLVSGGSSMLAFGDKETEAYRARAIIQYYGMNDQCFVGRPDASMKYFLVDEAAPAGSMAGEDCLSFDRETIEVRRLNDRWKIMDGSSILMDFADKESEARTSLTLIEELGFDRICYVGRPDASMVYFRADPTTKAGGRLPSMSSSVSLATDKSGLWVTLPPSARRGARITLTDPRGARLTSVRAGAGKVRVSTDSFGKGIYVVTITTTTGVHVRKVVAPFR